ncbi:cyclase family protein [Sinomicrobium soli]|uniref:cyclase family protein n=1 Tax=Sinomicrobium sp. N-1-3-6 TaxID=2219864 RepID=UPI000DCED306|nr:cyclase family protein [Sinomicrobium sp. N-1-3-6]RAV30913.1 cyclase family protein [Sinomicrobium sp. N-1-3-6]
MQTIIHFRGRTYRANLNDPLDISLPLRASVSNPVAWSLGPPEIDPVRSEGWTGSVAEGGAVNFNTIRFNPHAHGTHTECVGHITRQFYSVNEALRTFFFIAELITVAPEQLEEDRVVTLAKVEEQLSGNKPEALLIRTLPNDNDKQTRNYSHTNPPYLEEAAAAFLRAQGVKHLLVDLPSVDREEDGGKLLAHKAFWNTAGEVRYDATITEMIFVPDTVVDGTYLLNLQVAPFVNDASPSRPVLFRVW